MITYDYSFFAGWASIKISPKNRNYFRVNNNVNIMGFMGHLMNHHGPPFDEFGQDFLNLTRKGWRDNSLTTQPGATGNCAGLRVLQGTKVLGKP